MWVISKIQYSVSFLYHSAPDKTQHSRGRSQSAQGKGAVHSWNSYYKLLLFVYKKKSVHIIVMFMHIITKIWLAFSSAYFEILSISWTYHVVQGQSEKHKCKHTNCAGILHFVTIHEWLLCSWRSLRRSEELGKKGRSSWRNVLRRTRKESATWRRIGWMLSLSAKLLTSNSQTLRTSMKL